MRNTLINRKAVQTVAAALGDLNSQVVYVGGAVISHYIDDPAAEDVRPTKDIDIFLKLLSHKDLNEIQETLIKKGFQHDQEDGVICRFRYADLKVDVMSTKAIGWAPANQWFGEGLKSIELMHIDGYALRVLNYGYFLATKCAAFADRGFEDPLRSKDLEDIVYLLDNRLEPEHIFASLNRQLIDYLTKQLGMIFHDPLLVEIIEGHIYGDGRFEILKAKVSKLLDQFGTEANT